MLQRLRCSARLAQTILVCKPLTHTLIPGLALHYNKMFVSHNKVHAAPNTISVNEVVPLFKYEWRSGPCDKSNLPKGAKVLV
jgi:hypothetical protein